MSAICIYTYNSNSLPRHIRQRESTEGNDRLGKPLGLYGLVLVYHFAYMVSSASLPPLSGELRMDNVTLAPVVIFTWVSHIFSLYKQSVTDFFKRKSGSKWYFEILAQTTESRVEKQPAKITSRIDSCCHVWVLFETALRQGPPSLAEKKYWWSGEQKWSGEYEYTQ